MRTYTDKKNFSFISRWLHNIQQLRLHSSDSLQKHGKGFCILVELLYPALFGLAAKDTGLPFILSFLLVSGIFFVLLKLFLFLTRKFCQFLAFPVLKGRTFHPKETQWVSLVIHILFSYAVNLCFFCTTSFRTGSFYPVLLGFLFSTALLFTAVSGHSLFSGKGQKKYSKILFPCSVLILVSFLFFFCSKGFRDSFEDNSGRLKNEISKPLSEEELLYFQNHYLKTGTYTPNSLLYGSAPGASVFSDGKTDASILPSGTVDISSFFPEDAPLLSLHDWYIGENSRSVTLSGKIWYPREISGCPVLFFIHGNHTMTEPSYLGYDYLGRCLASYGYVVVSVDENYCNYYMMPSISGEDDARAILLLENIRQVLSYNIEKTCPIYGKINETKIAIGGHSRGGEAAADAAFLNNCDAVPENGAHKLSYHFPIQAVISVAPTSECYRPPGHELTLTDINYLLVHGSNDQDVSTMQGISQYQNVEFSGKEDHFKSFVYIAGANHGQFNSLWGQTDTFFPVSLLYNTGNFISETEQQTLLQVYVKEFLDASFLEDTKASRDFFQRNPAYQPLLCDTFYFTGYEDSSFLPVCTFEEDADVTHGTMKGTSISALHTAFYETEPVIASKRSGHAVCLSFSGKEPAEYQIVFDEPPVLSKASFLSFDVMDSGGKNPDSGALSLSVMLTDKEGRTCTLPASLYAPLYPPMPVTLFKLEGLLKNSLQKTCFQTIRIPLSDFGFPAKGHPEDSFSADCIQKITFLFQKETGGKVMLDNIGFCQ